MKAWQLGTLSVVALALVGLAVRPRSTPALGSAGPDPQAQPAQQQPATTARPAPVAPQGIAVRAATPDPERERRIHEAESTVDVTVYGASWCSSCKQTRAWLDQQGIAYNDKDIDKDPQMRVRLHALNPSGTIPTLDIEGQVVVGYAPGEISAAIRRAAAKKVN